MASLIASSVGFDINPNYDILKSKELLIDKTTSVTSERKISGVVSSCNLLYSSTVRSLQHFPGPVRPVLPLRYSADYFDIFSLILGFLMGFILFFDHVIIKLFQVLIICRVENGLRHG